MCGNERLFISDCRSYAWIFSWRSFRCNKTANGGGIIHQFFAIVFKFISIQQPPRHMFQAVQSVQKGRKLARRRWWRVGYLEREIPNIVCCSRRSRREDPVLQQLHCYSFGISGNGEPVNNWPNRMILMLSDEYAVSIHRDSEGKLAKTICVQIMKKIRIYNCILGW